MVFKKKQYSQALSSERTFFMIENYLGYRHGVNYQSRVKSLALKFYPEQVLAENRQNLYQLVQAKKAFEEDRKNFLAKNLDTPELKAEACEKEAYWDTEIENLIQQAVAHVKKVITNYNSDFITFGIVHDKDFSTKIFYTDSPEKLHFHLLFVRKDHKRFRVKQIFDNLGIARNEADNELFSSLGAETIASLADYSVYLTHETEQSIRDGKHQYNVSETLAG